MTRRLFLCAIVALLCGISSSWAQSFSISTNIPSLLTGNINIEPSIGLGSRVSLQLSMQVKPFKFGIPLPTGLIHTAYHNAKLDSKDRFDWSTVEHTENATFTPSLRYWAKGTYNRGLFFGLHGVASIYKYGLDKFDRNYSKGFLYGGGLSAGYSHELSTHWNIEAELGASIVYTQYDLLNARDVVLRKDMTRTLILPTRVSLSLVYVL